MRLQSAIFDMDGTLLDTMHIWDNLGCRMLSRMGYEPEPDMQEKVMVMTLRESAEYCKNTYNMPETVEEIMDLTLAEVEDYYVNHAEAKPGVKKVLSLLKMDGVWMYVATNTERHLAEAALKHAGIRDYFRGILTCGEVGVGKKDGPEIYERCLTRLQSHKRDTVVFEDAVHAIRTAKAAGFRVCAIYDPVAEADQEEIKALSDYYIRSFEEFFETSEL